ncbi:DUF4190 domain-containing protein [Streptomyces sp. V4-01]|uniref:DUF4190 domain-containing protein n=1 Tax=Actinacidiphila polyblastidii TaxID=3110430 RepID=A0ABU7PBB3_9ACTN|nr:DUF4190 domain-containing protein [Streptomyces sp. V4-01]
MNTAAHPVAAGLSAARDTRTEAAPAAAAAARAVPAAERGRRDADGMAVAAFLLGLPGLLVMNIVLGPAAIALALTACARGTRRRGRALLGLLLGVADLVVLVALAVTDHGVIWSFS